MPDRSSDKVFLALRDAILSGDLPVGSDHSIYEFASTFSISRTPVREAVLRLADLGMVEVMRNRGVRIRGLSAEEVRAIFEMRILLEVPAAGAAARTVTPDLVDSLHDALSSMDVASRADDVPAFDAADRRLHTVILGVLENPRVVATVRELRDATQAMGASTMNRARRLAEIEVEHEPIVEAIERGDQPDAMSRMEEHLVRTASALLTQVDPSGATRWRERR